MAHEKNIYANMAQLVLILEILSPDFPKNEDGIKLD
jgi:hypothetical protein